METSRIQVGTSAGAGYPIEIGEGLAGRLPQALDALGIGRRRILVSSPLVWKLHGATIADGWPGVEPVLAQDGERFKNLASVSRLYEALIRMHADRRSTLVVVGGGVLGDMAGFAAATYLRGIPVVHVPTTLLAQVDSSIGGKVGVNHALGKNLIGAFHPPAAVLTDPLLLATLPRREFRAGLYEVVKYGVIASRPLFDRLMGELPAIFARTLSVMIPVIAECCRIKARVVTSDERESGERRILNFGHTAGHGLEAVTRYRRFRHGEAIGYGMLVAAEIGVRRRLMPEADRERLTQLITQMGPLPPVADVSIADMLEAMRRDKKVVDGRLHFVLPASLGEVRIVDDVTETELADALRAVGMRGN